MVLLENDQEGWVAAEHMWNVGFLPSITSVMSSGS